MKNEPTDYSDELADLKRLHEENIGKKFTDEQFNGIFIEAMKMEVGLYKRAQRFADDMIGILLLLDEATHKWKEESEKIKSKENPYDDIKQNIVKLEKVIDYFANDDKANWGNVGTLAHIHEELGEMLHEKYDKHLGYSPSIEAGLKRHSTASRELLEEVSKRMEELKSKPHSDDIWRWKEFFKDLISGFLGVLAIIKDNNETKDKIYAVIKIENDGRGTIYSKPLASEKADEMKEYFQSKFGGEYEVIESISYEKGDSFVNTQGGRIEIKNVKAIKSKSDWILEIVFSAYKSNGRFASTSVLESNEFISLLKIKEYKKEEEDKFKKVPVTVKNKKPLRDEAIELAKKTGDKKLVEYLKTASLKSIQKRISGLREKAEK